MGYQLPNNSTVHLGMQSASSKAVLTAVTNAADAVFTASADPSSGFAKGDVVIITKSSWPGLLGVCARVKTVTGSSSNAITLEGVDTTDMTLFPAGSFSGELVKVEFTAFPYITGVSTSGGDQQTVSFQPLQATRAISMNTFKNPIINTLTMTHDAQDPIRPLLMKADKSQELVVVKFYNPAAASGKGETRLYSAKAAFQPIPSMEVNNVETVSVALSMHSNMIIYAGAAV